MSHGGALKWPSEGRPVRRQHADVTGPEVLRWDRWRRRSPAGRNDALARHGADTTGRCALRRSALAREDRRRRAKMRGRGMGVEDRLVLVRLVRLVLLLLLLLRERRHGAVRQGRADGHRPLRNAAADSMSSRGSRLQARTRDTTWCQPGRRPATHGGGVLPGRRDVVQRA
jgi:hypothetical protein